MLWGGLLLPLVGLAAGERPDAHAWLAWKPWIAFGYLVVCGSLLAFLAYNWLLRTVTPAQASSYAFANPVIAVLLGWLVLDEPRTWMFALGGALVVIAVGLVHGGRRLRHEHGPTGPPPKKERADEVTEVPKATTV